MPANVFTKRWALTLALLILFIALFPVLLPPLVRATGCGRVGGACGAVALIFGIYLRLPIIFGIGIYLTWLAARRAQAVGLQPWAPIFVFLTFLGAAPTLLVFGNFWAVSFVLGLVSPSFAILGFLLAALLGLSYLPDDAGRVPSSERMATLLIGALSLFLTAPQWLQPLPMLVGYQFLYGLTRLQYTILAPLYWITGGYLTLIVLGAFAAALALWIVRARQQLQ